MRGTADTSHSNQIHQDGEGATSSPAIRVTAGCIGPKEHVIRHNVLVRARSLASSRDVVAELADQAPAPASRKDVTQPTRLSFRRRRRPGRARPSAAPNDYWAVMSSFVAA